MQNDTQKQNETNILAATTENASINKTNTGNSGNEEESAIQKITSSKEETRHRMYEQVLREVQSERGVRDQELLVHVQQNFDQMLNEVNSQVKLKVLQILEKVKQIKYSKNFAYYFVKNFICDKKLSKQSQQIFSTKMSSDSEKSEFFDFVKSLMRSKNNKFKIGLYKFIQDNFVELLDEEDLEIVDKDLNSFDKNVRTRSLRILKTASQLKTLNFEKLKNFKKIYKPAQKQKSMKKRESMQIEVPLN